MPRMKFPKRTNGDPGKNPVEAAPSGIPRAETNTNQAPRTEPKTSARKPAIVRGETRANLVPINLEDEIRRLAYLLSERRGFEPGHETEDWLTAEREIRERYHQRSA